MKQHITPEQLQELSEEQKERLRSWWRPEKGDRYVTYTFKHTKIIKELGGENGGIYDIYGKRTPDGVPCLPLLSVGQCIELLEEKDPGSWRICCSKSGGWYITSSNLYAPKYHIITDGGKDFVELVDALWQAVKEVL
jgi:hypothetical protein